MRFTLVFTLVVLMASVNPAYSVPANPEPFNLDQPDGTPFNARQVGDERGAHFETLDGYSIVKDKDNWWNFAGKERGMLISSGNRVGKSDPKKVGLQKHLSPQPSEKELIASDNKITTSGPQKSSGMASATLISGPEYAAQTGTKKAIVILINFTDTTQNGAHTSTYYENLLFNQSPGANSMFHYYNETSIGNINVTGDIAGDQWFSAANNLAWYGGDVTDIDQDTTQADGNDAYIFKLAKEAVIAADPYVNYANYDSDSDGIIDHLIIVHAGNGQETSGTANDIWSHRWLIQEYNGFHWTQGYTTNDGVKAVSYTMQAESSPLGTFAHEFGHDLGLPDLYDTDYSSNGIGRWGLMGGGGWLNSGNTPAHFSVWSKYFLGWVNPTQVTSSLLNESINHSETYDDVYMILSNPGDSSGNLDWTSLGTGTGEYFLVENRRKTGYDTYLPGEGLLIWHIDESQKSNSNENRPIVSLEQADGLYELENDVDNGDANDPWYNTATGFTDSTTPNASYYNGTLTNIRVTDIGAAGSVMTCNLIIDWPAPSITFVSPTPADSVTVEESYVSVKISTTETLSTAILEWNGVNETMSYSSFWYLNKTNLPDGTYTFRVWGNDTSNNMNVSETRTVTVNTPYILMTILSPTNTTINHTNPLLNVTFGETVNYTWYNFDSATNSSFSQNTSNLTLYLALSEGTHNITIYANDSNGNLNSSTVFFTVDISKPYNITLNYPLNNSNISENSVNFNWSVLDNVSANLNTSLFLDGKLNVSGISTLNGTTTNYTVSNLTDGPHNWSITVYDQANNSNASAVSFFTVDTISPAVTNLTILPGRPFIGQVMNLSVNITEATTAVDSMYFTVTYPDGTRANLSAQITADLYRNDTFNGTQYGVYTVEVWSNDSAGNVNNTLSKSFAVLKRLSNTTNVTSGNTTLVINNTLLKLQMTAKNDSNASIDITAEISANASHFNLTELNTSIYRGFRYLNLTNSTSLENLSRIYLNVSYTGENLSGVLESSLSLYYWNGSTWFRLRDYIGSNITGGPFVYNAGINTTANYTWIVVNHFSSYSMAGAKDTDGDGIIDTLDSCINQAEIFNSYLDSDGCPDTAPVTSSGGGGGGGGSDNAVIATLSEITAGDAGVATFDLKDTGYLSEISVFPNTGVFNVKVSVEKIDQKPSYLADPKGKVASYLKIKKSGITDFQLEQATIKFQVPISWLKENNIAQDSIIMGREAISKWDDLETLFLSEDDEYAYFEAITPGFSYFVITGDEGSGYVEPVVEPIVVETPEPQPVATEAPPDTLAPTTPPETRAPETPETTPVPEEDGIKTWIIAPLAALVAVGGAVYLKKDKIKAIIDDLKEKSGEE